MAPTKKSLDQLAAKASKLNAKTDELNGIFEALEAKLEASKVGVTAWLDHLLEIESGTPGEESGLGGDEGWTIGYTRIGGRWRLAARPERWLFTMESGRHGDAPQKHYGESFTTGDAVALVSAPRAVRAAAAGVLDDLIEQVSCKIDEYLDNIEKAKATASVTG